MSKKLNAEIFIRNAKQVHGDKYDYSKVDYLNNRTKVCIICPIHGEFWQTPSNHTNKTRARGCPKCGIETTNFKNTYTNEDFIEKAKSVHGDKYNYSKVEYVDSKTKVCIICKEHGEFWQVPSSHLQGYGCPYCSNNAKMNNNEFAKKASLIHNNKYDYSKIKYVNTQTPICIVCPKHGEFWQIPNNHISKKYGCPKCYSNFSKMEKELLLFIKSKTNEEIVLNDKTIITPNELDIYIPSKKIAFEFNGLYWHSEQKISNPKYHLDKTIKCEKLGIRLIHIFEDEWVHKRSIVEDIISKAISKPNTIYYGRVCKIKEITTSVCKSFMEENHIQGYINSSINIGLFFNDELISAMSFGKKRINLGNKTNNDGEYELLRFSSKAGTSTIGGASKMFKYFVKKYNPKNIVSYCDRRFFNGDVYEKLGFKFTHYSKPNYYYVIMNKRENRFKYRKNILIEQGFDENKSEHQIMLERGIYRIYDCGCKCFIYEKTK